MYHIYKADRKREFSELKVNTFWCVCVGRDGSLTFAKEVILNIPEQSNLKIQRRGFV